MTAPDIEEIQRCIGNPLDARVNQARRIAGVIGAAPSQYSKSPALWNAAFRALGIDAVYTAMDVESRRLPDLMRALRHCDRLLGINVTVPHKLDVMQYLDEIDRAAEQIGAINTIVRAEDGRLLGYNTDGEGFSASILGIPPGANASFLPSLEKRRVLLLGAGGSARAVAYEVANKATGGELILCNRTLQHAQELAELVQAINGNARAISESELTGSAIEADLIVNCTIKGQGGVRRLENGTIVSMEAYSSLAPAHPMPVPEAEYGKSNSIDPAAQSSRADIEANQRASIELAKNIPARTGFYDLIYHPEETVFLRHGRLSGHRTMNGKAMIVFQAVAAFCDRICRAELNERSPNNAATRARVAEIMYASW